MGRDVKNIAKVSAATIGSRVMGLVRDAATMAYMSIGAVSAAYTFAFTLPNLFRRLLGEGALTAAIVPIFSQTLRREGENGAFAFLNKLLTRALILFSAIAVLGMAAAFISSLALGSAEASQRFVLGAQYSVVMMPYMTLICLAAVFTAALNVMDSFGVPSATPALLNVAIIGALFLGTAVFGTANIEAIGYCMCGGWLFGGAIQLALPAYWLRRKGWRFSFDLGKTPALGELYALFVPAVMGAAVIQLNIFVSKTIALFLSDSALPSLYLSSRILEFPLGVFTLSVATVYFPKLSKLNSPENVIEYKREYANGLIMTMCIAIPAALGIMATSRDILTLLFEWGLFKSNDVMLCLPVLIASVAGLPFFALATFSTRGFHSIKDTRTPVKISYWSFAANIAFSLALMKPFGAAGLAAANVLAAMLQAYMLNGKIGKLFGSFGIAAEVLKVIIASAAMAVAVGWGRFALSQFLEGKILALAVCAALIPAGAAFYFGVLKLLKFKKLENLKKIILRKK